MSFATRLLIVLLGAAALGGCGLPPARSAHASAPSSVSAERTARNEAPPASATVPNAPESSSPQEWSAMLERQRSAVVLISAVKVVPVESDEEESAEDEEKLAELFRRRGIPLLPGKPLRAALREEGCGIIVRKEGYILTNAHLVNEAGWMTVRLRGGRELPARVVGLDLPTDVAVVRIDADDLPTIGVGDAGRLHPGEWVAAIGAPFGLEWSVTAGIVSAVERTLPGDETFLPFIQTDLPLNPGNSGGPLLDARGEVVGLNSQIVFRGDGNAGVSFSIPIDIALAVANELIEHGHIERADLGIGLQDLDAALARAFGFEAPTGALVNAIVAGGPAALAKVKLGDIIVEINGRHIERAGELVNAMSALQPGAAAQLAIWRDHRLVTVSVRVARAVPPSFSVRETVASPPLSPTRLLSVRELSVKERRALETDGSLIVTGVSAPAVAAGIEAGDIVLAVGAQPLRSAGELQHAFATRAGMLPLLIEHEGLRSFIALPLDRPDEVHAGAATPEKR